MLVQPTNNNLKPAFELLTNTVNDFYLRGRPCLGATLKPKLYEHGFDEKLFDFKKFGDFLRAAENAGYVRLTKTSGGDIAIAVTGTASPTPAAAQPLLPFLLEPT